MSSLLYLQGYGRLYSIDLTKPQATACIEVYEVTPGDAGHGDSPDDITLVCRLSGPLHQQLQHLQRCGCSLEGRTVQVSRDL